MISLETLSSGILLGRAVSQDEAKLLWHSDFGELLYHADRIARNFKGNAVKLCSVVNAKSGGCAEDCKFCAQSSHHGSRVTEYPLIPGDEYTKACERAMKSSVSCLSIVTSGRNLSAPEMNAVCGFLAQSVANPDNKFRNAVSLGELDAAALKKLKSCGLNRFHHNLETAESFFPNICTTHTFADRIATIRAAREAGLEICCGGIMGLGETLAQRLEFVFTLRDLDVESVPLNFLTPIPGTPFENLPRMSAQDVLRTIAIFRFVLPDRDIIICGGREVNLRDLQSWVFHAGANGMMIGGYLTTQGNPIGKDLQMIHDLGYSIYGVNPDTERHF